MTDVPIPISALPSYTSTSLPNDPANAWFVVLDASVSKTRKINLSNLISYINARNSNADQFNLKIGIDSGLTIEDTTKTYNATDTAKIILGSTYTISDSTTLSIANVAKTTADTAHKIATEAKQDATTASTNAKIALSRADQAFYKANSAYDLIDKHTKTGDEFSGSEHPTATNVKSGFMSKDDKSVLDTLKTNRVSSFVGGEAITITKSGDASVINSPVTINISAKTASTSSLGVVKLSNDFTTNSDLAATTRSVFDAFLKTQNQNFSNFPIINGLPVDYSQNFIDIDSNIEPSANVIAEYNISDVKKLPDDFRKTSRGTFTIGTLHIEWGSQYLTDERSTRIYLSKAMKPSGAFLTQNTEGVGVDNLGRQLQIKFDHREQLDKYYSYFDVIKNRIDASTSRISWMIIGECATNQDQNTGYDISTNIQFRDIDSIPAKSSLPTVSGTKFVILQFKIDTYSSMLEPKSFNFKFPSSVKSATIYLQGAGGGGSGGSNDSTNGSAGNGGGGGGYLKTTIDIDSNLTYSLTLGKGGAGGSGGETPVSGSSGTYTEFRTNISFVDGMGTSGSSDNVTHNKPLILKAQGGRGGIYGEKEPYNSGGFYTENVSGVNTFGTKGYSGTIGSSNKGGSGGLCGMKSSIINSPIYTAAPNEIKNYFINFYELSGGIGGNPTVSAIGSHGCGGGGGGRGTTNVNGSGGGHGYAIIEFVVTEGHTNVFSPY